MFSEVEFNTKYVFWRFDILQLHSAVIYFTWICGHGLWRTTKKLQARGTSCSGSQERRKQLAIQMMEASVSSARISSNGKTASTKM